MSVLEKHEIDKHEWIKKTASEDAVVSINLSLITNSLELIRGCSMEEATYVVIS
jgi:hypothetical protein